MLPLIFCKMSKERLLLGSFWEMLFCAFCYKIENQNEHIAGIVSTERTLVWESQLTNLKSSFQFLLKITRIVSCFSKRHQTVEQLNQISPCNTVFKKPKRS